MRWHKGLTMVGSTTIGAIPQQWHTGEQV